MNKSVLFYAGKFASYSVLSVAVLVAIGATLDDRSIAMGGLGLILAVAILFVMYKALSLPMSKTAQLYWEHEARKPNEKEEAILSFFFAATLVLLYAAMMMVLGLFNGTDMNATPVNDSSNIFQKLFAFFLLQYFVLLISRFSIGSAARRSATQAA